MYKVPDFLCVTSVYLSNNEETNHLKSLADMITYTTESLFIVQDHYASVFRLYSSEWNALTFEWHF